MTETGSSHLPVPPLSPYQEMVAKRGGQVRNSRRASFPPEVTRARRMEKNRRSATACNRAATVLRDRYRDEFTALFVAELAAINTELGPLPGDPIP